MERLKLIKPTEEYEQQAYEYIQEFIDNNSKIHGTGGLDKYIGCYVEWLNKLEVCRNIKQSERLLLTNEMVPAETFMLIRENDNKLIGMIDIRLCLNKYLLNYGGHIGYSIRPTERRKGYNTYQLYLALKFCKEIGLDKVLITCNKKNLASVKSIQKYEGILENEVYDEDDNKIVQRYWIDVNNRIKTRKILKFRFISLFIRI